MEESFRSRIRSLRLIAFDFDGVFTDGKVVMNENGKESVICSRKDTLRFPELKALGIILVVISRERNSIVAARCRKMEIECLQGVDDKLSALSHLLDSRAIPSTATAFVGDDINDLDCLRFVGLSFTVADGHEKCRAAADYVTTRKGGDHAVREICDLILESK